MIKLLLKIVAVLLVILVVAAIGVYAWATVALSRIRSQTVEVHTVDFPIPFPIDPAEAAALGLTPEAAAALAGQRAVERGRHLVAARYTCTACHSENFGGGTMIDAFPIGRLLGPNVTTGAGSRTLDFQASDWDRIVRHGVLKTGKPAVMPSEDFARMSDQELSDIVTYIRSLPPVNNTVPEPSFGPLGKVLAATGQFQFSAFLIHHEPGPHAAQPPVEEASVEFGKHLAGVCIGCHGADFSGGPIPGGDPAWPQARNLTPDATGLQGWTYEQFMKALADSQRPDGTPLRPPMTFVAPFAKNMRDVESRALWMYLQSVPPVSKTIPN